MSASLPIFRHRTSVLRLLTPVSRLLSPVSCLLAACFVLTGCVHYQLGTGAEGKLAFRTLYIAPVENKTMLPEARAILSTQIREAFARDGRVALATSPDAADALLSVVITDYHREAAAAREGDTGLARKFNLTLGTTCTLHDNHGAKDFFENRKVSVEREAFTDGGQLQSEYQALPLLAESLAGKLTHTVLDVW